MKFGVPWSVKGIRPEARETAREAARRSGMSLGEWLNATILHQAAQDDDDSPDHGYDDEDDGEIAAVHQRLDELTKRIEKFARTGPAVHVQKRSRREAQDSQSQSQSQAQNQNQIAELIARLDRRLEQVVNSAAPVAPPLVPAMPPQTYAPQYAPAPVIAPPPLPYLPPQVQMPQPAPQAPPHPLRSPQAYAPRSYAPPPAPPPLPAYAPTPKAASVAMPASLEQAIAEIAARQRTLNDQGKPARPMPQARAPESEPERPRSQPEPRPQPAAAAPPPPAPVFAPVPTQDLSGLEDQLRKITNQIETLRRPGVEEAINALRAELAEIGNALTEAMPRHVIDTIEHQIAGLSQRIAEGRQAGVDAGALSGIELGLAEVRDALRGLTPAENLVGFNEAVNALAHKIDLIVAQKDPATLQQLEHAITTLREMAGNVASDAAVNGIAAQVQMLAERVEQIAASSGASDALNSLEHRISALADALEQRARSGDTVPPMLEALVGSLSDKIELIQQSRGGDNVAFDHLEDRIVKLVERLDASDSRLGHLEAIERGLADLLVHMQEMRANKESSGLRAENSGVVELKHDIARTHDVLDALRGTLGHVVDRLGSIEKDIRGDARARQAFDDEDGSFRMPVGKVVARAVPEAPPAPAAAPRPSVQAYSQAQTQALAQAAQALAQEAYQPAPSQHTAPQPQPAPQAPPPQPQPQPPAQRRLPPAGRMPLNPDLPPDQPLEPGSGPPQVRANPAARIAASEAALGGTGPQGADAPAGKSGFIAAARRAAKAAVDTAPAARSARIEPAELADIESYDDAERPSLRGRITKRVKSLFIAASIVAVVVGSVHIAGNIIGSDNSGSAGKTGIETARAPDAALDSADAVEIAAAPAPQPDASWANSLLQPPQPTAVTPPAAPPPAAATVAPALPAAVSQPVQSYPSLLSPPALNSPPQTAATDVTGSIGRPSTSARPVGPVAADRPSPGTLTAAIGGPRLRSAAAAGDAAAAHEVAVRFAEGRGVPASLQEAAFWFERASSKGLAPAQFRYASMLEKGQGVKKDLGQARRLYIAAAGNGNAKAMHNLAVLYAEGIEGKPDYATAAQWFRKAALRGVADSQFNLGVLAARGLGTEKNLLDAYKWFALAANQGDREAVKKRDELAVHLDAKTLAAAAHDVKAFVAEPQPPEATTVPEPKGGWDNATAAPATQNKPRPGMPMALGALETKKR